jgi:hypothetical protein
VVVVLRQPLGVFGVHRAHLAQAAGVDQAVDVRHVRQEAGPHRLEDDEILLPGELGDALRLVAGERERLLDQDVLAVLESELRVGRVEVVRCRDVDDVDVRISGQFLVAAVGTGQSELGRERAGRLRRTGTDREHPVSVQQQLLGEGPGDSTGGEDAPAQRAGGSRERLGAHFSTP